MEIANRLPTGMVQGKNETPPARLLRLSGRQVEELRAGRSGVLVAESGTLWLTGDRPGDYVLTAGARLPFAAGETLVVQALGGMACARLVFAGK